MRKPADKIEHTEAVPWYKRGHLLKNEGKYDEAIESLDAALKLDPNFIDAWVTKSAILGLQGKYLECIEACDIAIKLDSKNIFAWCNKGEALKDCCRYVEALEALDQAIELDSNDSDAWQYRGESLKSLGRNPEAEVALATAKELRSMDAIAEIFADHFAHWKITLPPENLKDRRRGHISQSGWLIQYCFGKDETGEYLDYYAAHRMTDDSHIRLYADGRQESLPALSCWLITSDDPVKAKQLKDDYERHNREVVKLLVEKEFDKFTINMMLCAGLYEENKKN